MKRFTEVYFDDALRLAQFLAERFNEEIKPVEMDSEGFPMPAQNEKLEKRTQALVVGDYAIAFIKKRKNYDDDMKKKNHALNRVRFGFMMREAREKANMSLEELSEYTGIKANNLERVEEGRFDASVDLIYNIAAALGGTFAFVSYNNN